MLGKILKYDLKWIYKLIMIFYCLALVFSILTRIFFSIENSVLFNVLSNICSGCAIAMMVSSLINTLMRSWVRFVRNIYKDEAYLTHTLPVEKKTIYLSKVLSAIICSFTTVIVIILCLFICYYSEKNMTLLKESLELAANAYNTTVITFIFTITFVLFLEIVFILLLGFVGIIIGHRFNKNKMAKSLIWGFGLYILTSGLTILLIFIFGLFNRDIMNLINTTDTVNMDSVKIIMYAGTAIYLIYNIIYYFVGRYQLERGVNID